MAKLIRDYLFVAEFRSRYALRNSDKQIKKPLMSGCAKTTKNAAQGDW